MNLQDKTKTLENELMNKFAMATVTVALYATVALLGWTTALAADAPKTGPTCADIHYNAEFLAAYPRAPAACQEVVTNGGKLTARFSAAVTRVEKEYIQLNFLNTMGKPIEPVKELTLLTLAGQTVRVNGKDVAYGTLAKGDKIDFWLPENAVGFITNPNSTALSTIVLP
jgi:hypothetical protein